MTAWIVPLAVGIGTGVLSAWGVGGGPLRLLGMSRFVGVGPAAPRGLQQRDFVPPAGAGLLFHRKSGLLEGRVLRCAIPWGLAAAAVGAWLSLSLDTAVLRRPFGVYLLVMGVVTMIKK